MKRTIVFAAFLIGFSWSAQAQGVATQSVNLYRDC